MKKLSKHKAEKAALRRGNRRNAHSRYAIQKSPLWGLKSIHRLAQLVRLDEASLRNLAENTQYRRFVDETNPKKPRQVQEPVEQTMRVHYRFVLLLDSIQRPAFLHSATRGRSYVSNARAHVGRGNVVVTDIERFYENTSFEHVKGFFTKELGWPNDMARIMASICTADGHLPTGSCLSPLLSYFAHQSMFKDIEALCVGRDVVLTLYVDDLTLSGRHASKWLLSQVKALIRKRGLRAHKDRFAATGHPMKVTGAIVTDTALHVPNAQHLEIIQLIQAVAAGENDNLLMLRGKLASVNAIDPPAAERLSRRLDREIRDSERA